MSFFVESRHLKNLEKVGAVRAYDQLRSPAGTSLSDSGKSCGTVDWETIGEEARAVRFLQRYQKKILQMACQLQGGGNVVRSPSNSRDGNIHIRHSPPPASSELSSSGMHSSESWDWRSPKHYSLWSLFSMSLFALLSLLLDSFVRAAVGSLTCCLINYVSLNSINYQYKYTMFALRETDGRREEEK